MRVEVQAQLVSLRAPCLDPRMQRHPRITRVLSPAHPLRRGVADELVEEEVAALRALGVPVSLFAEDVLEQGELRPRPAFEPGDVVLYRGWMKTLPAYDVLASEVTRLGATLLTRAEDYAQCHHLPRWYEALRDVTPETRFYAAEADLEVELSALDWPAYFVKDFVKSLTTSRGSIASRPAEAAEIARAIAATRGEIEGGLCVRRVERFVEATERRIFVAFGEAHAHDGVVPDLAREIATRIASPFASMDVVQDEAGTWRVVELGDGQVSDRKAWAPADLAALIDGMRR
jgi:hypothetical protein